MTAREPTNQPPPPPTRSLAKTLGQAGEIEPETEGILMEYDVDFSDFSSEVLECLPKNLPWSIPPEELSTRRDLRWDSNTCVMLICVHPLVT